METIVKLFTYFQNLKLRIYSADYTNESTYNFDFGKFVDPNFNDFAEDNDIRTSAHNLGTLGHFDILMLNNEDWYIYGPVSDQETLQILVKYDKMASVNLELIDEFDNPHGYDIYDVPEGKLFLWTAAGGYQLVNIYVHGECPLYYSKIIKKAECEKLLISYLFVSILISSYDLHPS